MSKTSERMTGTSAGAGQAPIQRLPNEFAAIQKAFLARWHELGWAKLTGQSVITYDEAAGECSATIDIQDQHLNPGGIAHGGVLFSVIDTLMGYVVFRSQRVPERIATESQTIDFIARPTGTIICTARIDKRGTTTAFCSGEAHDAEGRLVARSTSVWAIRGLPTETGPQVNTTARLAGDGKDRSRRSSHTS